MNLSDPLIVIYLVLIFIGLGLIVLTPYLKDKKIHH